MSFLRQLAGETFIYGTGHILPRILNYLFLTPFLTYYLSQVDYGKHGLYYMFSSLLMIVFTFRLETAFFRFGTEQKNRERYFSTALLFILALSVGITAILGSMSTSIADIISKTSSDWRFVWYVLGIISLDSIAAIPFARLRLEQKAKQYAWLKIINVLVILGFTFILFFGLDFLQSIGLPIPDHLIDPRYYLDYVFIGNIVGSLIVLLILLTRNFSFTFNFDREALHKMLKYAWPLIPVGVAGIINIAGDVWFITRYLPGDQADNLAQSGVYNAAKRIAVIMSLFTVAFNYAVEPFFFRNADHKDAKSMYAKTAEAYLIVGCLIIISLVFYLDIFQFILGSDFRGGLHIIPIALLAFLFLGLYYNFSAWYKLTDNTIYGMYIALVGAGITILLNIILLPQIGYIGSSMAALVCFMTMSALCVYFGRQYYPIKYNFNKMGKYLLTTLVFIGISTALNTTELPTWSRLAIHTILLIGLVGFIYNREKDGLLRT